MVKSSIFRCLEHYNECSEYDSFGKLAFYNNHQYQKVISEFEKIEYMNQINDEAIKQELLWLRASAEIHTSQFNGTSEYFVNLLHLTKPFNNLEEVFDGNLSKIELEVISSIIYLLLEKSELIRAKHLMIRLTEYIETELDFTYFSPYLRALYNLSRIFYINGEYDQAIEYAEKGISYCNCYNCLSQLDRLYNIGGRAYYKSGNTEKGQHYLMLYILLSQNRSESNQLNNIYTSLIENYNLHTFFIS